jgi:cellulose synthase (UDP-forming)
VRRGPRPRAGLPAPEPFRRRLYVRSVAVAALLATAAYLCWRIADTLPRGIALVTGIPFLVLEAQGLLTLALFVFSTWDVSPAQPPPPGGRRSTVTALIATYNEPIEVLLPTVAGALAMDGDHETWLLDDGDRPEVEELAHALGVRYVTRGQRQHAKAGNLNHALGLVETDLIAVFDADHVPEPHFLTRTLPYFADPRVALVQTPQDFYNSGSFEHLSHRPELHEESLFYRVIQAGKNNAGAAHWCGTNAVLRVDALLSVGGVATETLTEDFHTTVRLHRAGWRTVYHNQVLASGLAAGTPEAFYAQRRRWGRGAMQLLRIDNPLTSPGLTLRQRLSYLYSVLAWFDGWRTLGLAVVPTVAVMTGLFPVDADPLGFVLCAGSAFVLQQTAIALLGRGFVNPTWSLLFEVIRMPSNLAATLALLLPGTGLFAVTAKGRTGQQRTRARVPRLLIVLAGLLASTVPWVALSLAGLTPTHYANLDAALVPEVWLMLTLGFLVTAICRISSGRFAAERRDGHRFPVRFPATLAGMSGTLVDVSLGGAQILLRGPGMPIGAMTTLAVRVPDRVEPLEFRVTVRSRDDERHHVQFLGRPWVALAALSATSMGAGAARWVLSDTQATTAAAARPLQPA